MKSKRVASRKTSKGTRALTVAGASAHIEAVLKVRDEQESAVRSLTSEVSKFEENLRSALRKEDYLKADQLKTNRTIVETALADKRRALAKTQGELTSVREHFAELYVKENPRFLDDFVSVYRVVVVDPRTGDRDSAEYLEGSKDIQLTIGTAQFDAEADQVERWAERKGFICIRSEARADF
jgi:ElaB/YqjD/DUF883 family membrane-anchored ribosome-binding protein